MPIADFLCVVCGEHRRATGRQLVTDLMQSDPIGSHQSVCTGATTPLPTTSTHGREKDR
ncbi:hypothetical protein [Streptomyces sp. UH6]|uniref:hypothetical protein n=1 Tax=Streptomyces sp. UH6 TaxID=2748379 RepID=UPI00211E5A20|nr:hypothetical protein [Streptomyces sp. UH6]